MTFFSPSESRPSAQPTSLAPCEGGTHSVGSSLEVSRPFSVRGPRQPRIRSLASAATFRPRRFSRPRRLAPPGSLPSFPRVTLLGFSVLQGTPVPPHPRHCCRFLPSWPCLCCADCCQSRPSPCFAAPKSASASPHRWTFRAFLASRPSPPASGFPSAGARPPLGPFSCETSLPAADRVSSSAPVAPSPA